MKKRREEGEVEGERDKGVKGLWGREGRKGEERE